jgi:hypothetical protein
MGAVTEQNLERLVVGLTEQVRDRYYGKYRGLVEDVEDPEGLGRIVASVPSVYGDLDSPWALPCTPFAGDGYGFAMLPKAGDGVWIEFEAGDPSRPIWTGFWWASGEIPTDTADQRIVITPEGLKLVMDDAGKILKLAHPGGAEITLTDNDITLEIGGTKLVLSASGLSVNDGAFEVR